MTMDQQTEDRLRVEAAQSDPSRFADLYEENFYRVYGYIARRVGQRHVAEDLTSDVFREALAGIRKFEWRGVPFVAWLFRIAARTLADHFRRAGRESAAPENRQAVNQTAGAHACKRVCGQDRTARPRASTLRY